MINVIWLVLIVLGVVVAAGGGHPNLVTQTAISSSRQAVETALGLVGIMALWLGLVRIAERSGLVDLLARFMVPLTRHLFPSIPRHDQAHKSMMLNLAANLLGVGSAATPLGLKAMAELERLNPEPGTATPAMCTFLALNTTCITLVPGTVVALRAIAGSQAPAEIVLPTILATCCATVVAVSADWLCRRLYPPVPRR